jgi:hypothetical protein
VLTLWLASDKPLYANFRISAGLAPPKDCNQRKTKSRTDRGEVPSRMQDPDNRNARPFRQAKNSLTSPIRDFSEDSDVFLAYTRLAQFIGVCSWLELAYMCTSGPG